MMNEAEQRQEYIFIDRRVHPNGVQERALPPIEEEAEETAEREELHRRPKWLRGSVLVPAVQAVLAILMILLAVAVRFIGGETAQNFANEYRRLTETGAIDLQALVTPIAPQEDAASEAESSL